MKPTSLRHGIATVTYGRFMRGQTLSHRPPADSRSPSRRASEIWGQLHRTEVRIYAGLQDGSGRKVAHEVGRGEIFHVHVITGSDHSTSTTWRLLSDAVVVFRI